MKTMREALKKAEEYAKELVGADMANQHTNSVQQILHQSLKL